MFTGDNNQLLYLIVSILPDDQSIFIGLISVSKPLKPWKNARLLRQPVVTWLPVQLGVAVNTKYKKGSSRGSHAYHGSKSDISAFKLCVNDIGGIRPQIWKESMPLERW